MSHRDRLTSRDLRRIFPGDSEMADRMRRLDWDATDLGPVDTWPENLCAAVRLCLASRFPILLWWGAELCLLYNDAYLPWLSEAKHPRALGRPGREAWGEVWDTIGPMLESVVTTARATWSVDTELYFDRKLRLEEVYVTWTFAPILGLDGQTVDGVFCPCYETTRQMVSPRRLETLRKLGIRAGEARTVAEACQQAVAVLSENTRDIPFAAIYVVGEPGDDATLCATMLPPGDHLLPDAVCASEDDSRAPWPLASVLRSKRAVDCPDLPAHGVHLAGVPWPEDARDALLIPIFAAHEQIAGVLVAGISPRRPFDMEYRTFFELVARHIATTIADARAYEAERKRAEALAEIDRAKTAFFSNVSHEFRTPLTLMLGPLEEVLADATEPLPPAQRERLEAVHRNSQRLLKVVNTLLDFSRIEAGRTQAVYEPTDLSALTAELASTFRSACEKAGLRLVVDCPPLPEPVYIDQSMWEKVVLNVISNAFKFTLEGEIVVRVRAAGDAAELTVQDTGTGIPAEELPRIFERFHRVEGSRGRTFEGTGIGLALVQELVKLHGGSVRAESSVGQGSTFVISVPRGIDHLAADQISAARRLASTSAAASPYVEEAVPDGEAALSAALARPPDLVLADVMMPRLDGFGLLRALRADPRTSTIPAILLSARAGEESRVDGLAVGADDYLVKPFSARELLARVSAHLELNRLRQEASRREQALLADSLAARQHLEAVLERISDGFITLDRQWRYTAVNDRACLDMGLSRERILGRRIWDIYPDTFDTQFGTELRRAFTEQRPATFEYFYPARNRWYENRLYPSADGISVFFAEITDRKQAEVLLNRAHNELEARVAERTAELERANASLRREAAERRRVEAARTELLRRLVTAQEDERRRVAHDIHDGVTQLAAAAALHLDEVLTLQTDMDGEPRHELERARDLTRQAATESRRLIGGLRPEVLDDFGLVGALRQEVEGLQAAGWPARFEADRAANERLAPELEMTLYRVAQEALLNIRKHTKPARVRVRLGRSDERVQLEVRDYGGGFDPERARDGAAAGERVGVAGMRERLHLLGGRVEVRSRPGRGTTIRAILPLPGA